MRRELHLGITDGYLDCFMRAWAENDSDREIVAMLKEMAECHKKTLVMSVKVEGQCVTMGVSCPIGGRK